MAVKFVAPRVPLVDNRGNITREWYLLFQSLFDSSDGPGSIPEAPDDVQMVAPIYDDRPDLLALQAVPTPSQSLGPIIDPVQLLAATLPLDRPSNLAQRVNDIEAFLATDPYPQQASITILIDNYTPTLSSPSNLDAQSVNGVFRYVRVGKIITMSGFLTVDPTAAGVVGISLSLPVASNFATATDASGSATAPGEAGYVFSDSVNDVLRVNFTAVSTASHSLAIFCQYEVL